MCKRTTSANMKNTTIIRLSVAMLLLVSIVFGGVSSAQAGCVFLEKTQTMKVAQKFGYDGGESAYKILVQSYSTGNRFFVWYRDSLELEDRQDVVITFGTDDWWCKITNLKNGRESEIKKVLRVN